MKDCKKIHPLLSLYREGELSAREKMVVEKHVSGCPVARAELERLERLQLTLRKLPEPKIPHDLHDRIMARLGRKPERKVLWFNPSWILAATAACLALILLTQYPRWSNSRNENLTLNRTAPAPSAPSKNGSGIYDYSIEAKHQQNMQNKPMVMASRAKVAKKKESKRETSSNVDFRLDKSTANSAVLTQPTMVVAMAPVPVRESAEEPEKALKTAKVRASLPAELPQETLQGADASVQAALPPASAGAAAPAIQYKAADQLSNAQFGATLQPSQTFWSGSYSPVTVESQTVITDQATFQAEWNKVQPNQSLPPADFTTQAVILLDAGDQPTTGYAIRISRLEDTTTQLIVHYQIEVPPPGTVTGQMFTRPWAMQVIPKPVKPVTFQKD